MCAVVLYSRGALVGTDFGTVNRLDCVEASAPERFRFTVRDVLNTPLAVVGLVRRALAS